ncbi:conjugal transfer protein TraM [Phocoenobacter uteri]|uniref:Conjugal transfer protein TraM n=1 Tax=Phocoenobacter uteri TaxID=146806 RepID=A0A379DFM2_9PAST|nr:hypothetical protein [Phocoenobacter uteri]MDG6882834.1 hypothetical protein [Phocoenobacter uteri]SUB76421.1 conjugal transfer protein TraM [Phocoenobacter uteri]
MSDEIQELITEIAQKHGVVITKDDPIAIAFTLNRYLLEQTKKNQETLIANLKSDIEEISLNVLNENNKQIKSTQEICLKLVNEHITKSKTAINNVIDDSGNNFKTKITESIKSFKTELASFGDYFKSLKIILILSIILNIIFIVINFYLFLIQ